MSSSPEAADHFSTLAELEDRHEQLLRELEALDQRVAATLQEWQTLRSPDAGPPASSVPDASRQGPSVPDASLN
jgi:hypothetical protein